MRQFILFYVLNVLLFHPLFAQDELCLRPAVKHQITSQALGEEREYWVSLPLGYADTNSYSVIYVLDAEWRFDLVRHMAFDLGAHHKIQPAIVVGIPHVEWKNKRGIDLTFSHSRMEYDGDEVDSTWYNKSNSGGAQAFYEYLINELIPAVNKQYASNEHETLIGHSYGGYFGAYLLSLPHPFEVLHIYDPSVWYSDGEVIDRFQSHFNEQEVRIHLSYQATPAFHASKIKQLIKVLKKQKKIRLSYQKYSNETHNSLFLDSFYQGIRLTNQEE